MRGAYKSMRLLGFGKKSRLKNKMAVSGNQESPAYEENSAVSEELELAKAKDSSMSDLVQVLTDHF